MAYGEEAARLRQGPYDRVSRAAGQPRRRLLESPSRALIGALPVKVLHLVAGNLYGGVESMLVTLARERAAAPDMQPSYGLCFDGRLRAELGSLDAPVRLLGQTRLREPWSVVRARRNLSRWLAREAFAVAVCHSAWAHALFAGVLKKRGIPVAFFQHDVSTGKHWLERLARRTEPDLIVSNSRFTSASAGCLFPKTPVDVQHPPVAPPGPAPTEQRAHKRRELGCRSGDIAVVHVSRAQAWKGHARLMRALSQVRSRNRVIALVVGGAQRDGEQAYLGEIQQLAQRLGIGERVRFLGQRTDVAEVLAAADIHCQPNLAPEPFGIVFVEALYAALPVVTMDMGGAREIVTPDTGILASDEAALVRALEQLADDDVLRRKLGSRGPARAAELCSPATQLPHFEQVLSAVARA